MNPPSRPDPERAPARVQGQKPALQRAWDTMSPAAQGGLMLLGIVLAIGMIWLATRFTSGRGPAVPESAPAGEPTPSAALSLASATPLMSNNASSGREAGGSEAGAGEMGASNVANATLAPPATLKPAATKAPTRTPLPTATPAPTATPLPTATPTPLPVPDWRATGKLTSIEYINTIVIERARPKTGIGVVIPGQDRIVLQVVGNIHAGIDLNKIKPENVRINGKSIRLTLPHAEIISVELMPESSRVYESNQTLIFSDYQGLEIEAMTEARQKLQDNSAHNQKMLEMAETLARLQLTELLRSLGYEQIDIVFE